MIKFELPRLRISILILAMLGYAASPCSTHAAPRSDQLVEQAMLMGLDRAPAWLAMLHYHPTFGGGMRSHAADPAFFVSSAGRFNPAAELMASIRLMRNKRATFACRFPLRAKWLSGKLNLPPQGVNTAACANLRRWLNKTRAQSVTLVFPSANMSAPSSMFGHTLLRFNNHSEHHGTLLDLSVTFAAAPPEDASLFRYVSGSISGAFPGRYFMVPYHQKIREYANIESRDIWEYDLNLAKAEVQTLVLHLWEVRNIRFEYYFADENCAYRLLELLQVARPFTHLTESTRFFVTPLDTIQLLRDKGVITVRHYRPSLARLLDRVHTRLSRAERHMAKDLANHPHIRPADLIHMDAKRQKAVYRAAFRLMQWRAYRLHQTPEYDAIFPYLENASAKPSTITPTPPDQGHSPFRTDITGGHEQQPYLQIGIRPAYHGATDPSSGYIRGSEITVLETLLRWPRGKQIRLQRLNFLEMASLQPYRDYLPELSWTGGLALRRTAVALGHQLVGQLSSNMGLTFDFHRLGRFSLLPGITLRLHKRSSLRWFKPGIQIRHQLIGHIGTLAVRWNTRYSREAPHTVNDLEITGTLVLSASHVLRGGIQFRDKIQRKYLDAWGGYAFYW